MKILLADSDRELVDMFGYWLRGHGFETIYAFDGLRAVDQWRQAQPDLSLVDSDLPRMDGFEVCRRITSDSNALVLLIGTRLSDDDEIRGLTLGAAGCLAKPLSPGRLLARIRALARRAVAAPLTATGGSILLGGLLLLDAMRHTVTRDGHTVRLTPIESRLLHLLITNCGQVLPTGLMIERVWGYEGEGGTDLVKTHIRHLRQKVERIPSAPELIQTVPGVGYTFVDLVAPVAPVAPVEPLDLDLIPTILTEHAVSVLHGVGA